MCCTCKCVHVSRNFNKRKQLFLGPLCSAKSHSMTSLLGGNEKTLQSMMSPLCASLCFVHLFSALHSNRTTMHILLVALFLPLAFSMLFVDILFIFRACEIAGMIGMIPVIFLGLFLLENSWHLALSQRAIQKVGPGLKWVTQCPFCLWERSID